ncbi:MAG: toll/interleukin-1 receptor domain-containing protein [Rubrivivax sp.]
MTPSAPIFISYRREDTAGYARAIGDELGRAFGAERVFIDVDDIEAGEPFSDVIERAVGASAVLVVLIGPRWRGERAGTAGTPASVRLFEANDFVRREVAAGLAAGCRVIPVLLDGAAMPGMADLPSDLAELAGRNAMTLRPDRFGADMAALVVALQTRPSQGSAVNAARGRARAVFHRTAAALAVGVVLAGVAGWLWLRSAVPAVAARSAVDGDWQAQVGYDWPGADHMERFRFSVEGTDLRGSATFLGVPRGIEDGHADAQGLQFVTRTTETLGEQMRQTTHRYRARLTGDQLQFVMQTEGSATAHVPVEFSARRVGRTASD